MKYFLFISLLLVPTQEWVAAIEVTITTESVPGSTDVVSVTNERITRVKRSWRVENNLPMMAPLEMDDIMYILDLVRSDGFRELESSEYSCESSEERIPITRVKVVLEEAGEKTEQEFRVNCSCDSVPNELCGLIYAVRYLEKAKFRNNP